MTAPLYFCTAPSVTVIAPPPVIDEATVMLPLAPASSVRFLPAVATVELNRILPAEISVVVISPSVVPVLISTSPCNVTAFVNVTLSSVVVISPAVVNVPDLFAPKVTAPPAVISPASAIVVLPDASIDT